jgi:signal transduction protein with GAF and PtsI domain
VIKRQGDILFVPVDEWSSDRLNRAEVDEETDIIESGVVAEGEATGHAHRVRAAAGVAVVAIMADLFIRSQEGENIHIDHEEHDTITLPPGDYQVVRQREYGPDANRLVHD